MESHLLNDLAVPLLSSLSRPAKDFADLVPGDSPRSCTRDSVHNLTLTPGTVQRAKVS
jgi:hypothetical protein